MSASEREILRRLAALEAQLNAVKIIERPDSIGTWTPAFQGSGTAGTFTYNAQTGSYTRVGNRVFFDGDVGISAISVAPTGSMRIIGLPFTVGVNAAASWGYINAFNYSATALALLGFITGSTTRISMLEAFDNALVADAPAANFTNAACRLIFTGSYQI